MKKIIAVLLLTLSSAVFAAEGYLSDTNGQIVRSGTGLCWHDGYWTPANAVEGCDPVTKPAPYGSKVTISSEVLFDFDKATLKPEGKAALDTFYKSLQGVNLELVIATGYTDRIGTVDYNMQLSTKRAKAIQAYLVSKGMQEAKIFTLGKGKTNPVTGDNCKGSVVTNKLIQCLAPDRRAIIEVIGTK